MLKETGDIHDQMCTVTPSDCSRQIQVANRMGIYQSIMCGNSTGEHSIKNFDPQRVANEYGKFLNNAYRDRMSAAIAITSMKAGVSPLSVSSLASYVRCLPGNVKVQYVKQFSGWDQPDIGNGDENLKVGSESFWKIGDVIDRDSLLIHESCLSAHGYIKGHEDIPLGPACGVSEIFNINMAACEPCGDQEDPDWHSSIINRADVAIPAIEISTMFSHRRS